MAGHKVAQKEYETKESGVGVIAEQSKQFKYIVNWLVELGKCFGVKEELNIE